MSARASHQCAGQSVETWHGMTEADDEVALPTELDTVTCPRYLMVGKDKSTVRYVGKGNHAHDFGAIRANLPAPRGCALYYFEVTVVDAGQRGCVAIGLADANVQLDRQPGCEPNSYAYFGEDGRKYHDSERGEVYGPGFVQDDVVGCGLLCAEREIFFTKNGKHLGVAFDGVGLSRLPPRLTPPPP